MACKTICNSYISFVYKLYQTILHFCYKLTVDTTFSMLMNNKSSAVAKMGDRGHNRHGPKRGGCYAPFAEAGTPSNTMHITIT